MTSWDFAPTHVVPGPDSRPGRARTRPGPRSRWTRCCPCSCWSAGATGRRCCASTAGRPGWTAGCWSRSRRTRRRRTAGGPHRRPRPLLARAEEALGRYRRAAGELADGSLDGETFRLRTRGLKVGMVVDGESVWLYDAEHERWVHCDGRRLSTLAASAEPAVQPGRAPAAPAAPGAAGPADLTRVTGADPPRPPDGPRPAAVEDPAAHPRRPRPGGPTPDTDAPPPTRVVPDRETPTPDTDPPPPTRVVPDRETPTPTPTHPHPPASSPTGKPRPRHGRAAAHPGRGRAGRAGAAG
ncbi:hypothetical protein ACFQ60_09530 [Streptomyces zhihengii]